MTDKKFKLDIFDVLKRISKKEVRFTEEEEKSLQPIVVMRWLSGSKSERQIYMLNQGANKYAFTFYNHKKLMINLLTCASSGFQRYQWLKRKTIKTNTKLITQVIAEQYGYPTRQCNDLVNILEHDIILGYAIDMGKDKTFIRELKKELKTL